MASPQVVHFLSSFFFFLFHLRLRLHLLAVCRLSKGLLLTAEQLFVRIHFYFPLFLKGLSIWLLDKSRLAAHSLSLSCISILRVLDFFIPSSLIDVILGT